MYSSNRSKRANSTPGLAIRQFVALALLSFTLPTPHLAMTVRSDCNFGHSVSKRLTPSPTPPPGCSFIGGLFSVHQDKRERTGMKYRCSLSHFDRFGVEQAEALIFAAEILRTTLNRTTISGHSIYDSCGLVPPTEVVPSESRCVEDQARALNSPDTAAECALATVVGPFYRGDGSDSFAYIYDDPNGPLPVYENLLIGENRGVLSLVDEPFVPQLQLPIIRNQIVYMQPSCELQASAAVEFLLAARWQRVAVVVSGDACGEANREAFKEEIRSRRLECDIDAEYHLSNDSSVKMTLLSDFINLWRHRLDESNSPRAVVVLSSVPFALNFFEGYFHFETMNATSFGFLLGDFWGDPDDADELYDLLMRVTETARSVVALRTVTNGLDEFQEHMTSIRANSTEIRRNSLLADYWENYFNCSISEGTCDNTTSLPRVDRPILRNYKTSLVIDSVFLLSAYIDSYAFSPLQFFTNKATSIFIYNMREETTNVSSWTGNQVRIGSVGSSVDRQPVTWSYEFLAWTRETGRNRSFSYGVWTFYGKAADGNSSLRLNDDVNVTIWAPELLSRLEICPTPTTANESERPTASSHESESPSSSPTASLNEAISIIPAIAIPLVVLLLHVVVFACSICVFGLVAIRQNFASLLFIFPLLLTLASVLVSILVAVDGFSPCQCETLALDFVINVLSVLCFAALFVEALSCLVRGLFNRLQVKIVLVVLICSLELIVAATGSFRGIRPMKRTNAAEQCLVARGKALPLLPYWINAAIVIGIAIVIWITYAKGYQSRLKGRSVIESGVASLLGILYIVGICLVSWAGDCKSQAYWLVVLAAFPAMVTFYVTAFFVWNRYSFAKKNRSLPGEIEGRSRLPRDPSHQYVDKAGNPLAISMNPVSYWDEDIIAEISSVVITPSRIQQGIRIGRGNFGYVHKGVMDSSKKIAVKSVQDEMNRKEVNDFIREGLQMRDFKHPNVMELYGICWCDDPSHPNHRSPFIVLPYMELGDLKMYLRKCRPGHKPKPGVEEIPKQLRNVSLVQLVKFSHQIAKGMNYISNKGIVHRDLAARNCMVNWDLEVKVADFGLSRAIKEGKDYYRMGQGGQLPVRWMSLESLLDFVFTAKSDVWSYGVTIWEVMTLAMVPYPGVSNKDVVAFLKSGSRLEKPDECPTEMYHIMLQCWAAEPDERLTFAEIVNTLEEYLTELVNYFDLEAEDSKEKDPYARWSLAAKGYSEREEMTLEREGVEEEITEENENEIEV